jgi:hypothetical protein
MQQKTALLILLFFLLTISPFSFGQTHRDRVYINGGSSLWENFTKEMYLYPSFKEGLVDLKDGRLIRAPLNYNKVLATVQFINEKNDTLVIANESTVNLIRIGDDLFFYRPQCVQSINPESKVKLYRQATVRIADVRQVGALGVANTSGGVESLNQVYTWMNSYQLQANEKLLLSKETNFYIDGNDNELLPASKSSILRRHAKNAARIKNYIKSNKTNFNNEKDLLQLTQYISTL